MKTHKEVRDQVERVGVQLRGLVAEGRGDEAINLALTMLLQLEHRNINLVLELALERRQRAGRKTEKIDPAQLLLMLELMVTQAVDESTDLAATTAEDEVLDHEQDELEAATPSPTRRRPVRRRLPRTLPRDVIHHVLNEDQRSCATCGEPMTKIGEDVSELLELVPSHFRVQEHHRAKYACGRCKDGVKTAAGPDKLIDKGLAGPGLLAHVAVSKYEDHLPLNRLSEIYARGGWSWRARPCADGWRRWRRRCGRWWSGSGKRPRPRTRSRPTAAGSRCWTATTLKGCVPEPCGASSATRST